MVFRSRRPWPALAALALVAVATIALCGCSADSTRARARVITLRDWTFVGPDGATKALELPARVSSSLPTEACEYRLRCHVDVPDDLRGRRLTLAFSFLHARATLRANGAVMDGLTPEMNEGFRGTDQPRWRIPGDVTRAGALDLELTVSYPHVMSGWLDVAPRLSDTDYGDPAFLFVSEFDHQSAIVCLATVLLMSSLYGAVFVRDRRRTAYGWLALQGLFGGAGYAIAYAGVLSQTFFGKYENDFIPLFLCIGVACSVEFTCAQFGLGRPSRLWWVATAGCAVLAIAMPGPFLGPLVMPKYSCAMAFANIAYQVPVAGGIWRRRRSFGALTIFLSWAGLAVLGTTDICAWSGLGEIAWGLRTSCAGLAFVALMQAVALSVEHQATLSEADGLNTELRARVHVLESKTVEIGRLNTELRRQVGVRADALAEVLARAGGDEPAPPSLAVGSVLAGRYKIARPIGAGGMGVVYEVVRLTDGEHFALKLMAGHTNTTAMARFAREAQLISQLDHPNIVRIIDVDVTTDGHFFLVVEFVDGLSLEHHRACFSDVEWAVSVLAQIAEGLVAIHARGIVHRDLKPDNILVTFAGDGSSRPLVKIADFGVSYAVQSSEPAPALAAMPNESKRRIEAALAHARTMADTPPTLAAAAGPSTRSPLTQTGVLVGTPMYMAPEMALGARRALAPADIFSFGVVAYEVLSGALPFDAPPILKRAHLKGRAPTPLHVPVLPVDDALRALLARCLSHDPTLRPDAATLSRALRAWAPAVPSAKDVTS